MSENEGAIHLRRHWKPSEILIKVLKYLFLVCIVLTVLLPVLWMSLSAFRPADQITIYPPNFFPAVWSSENFQQVMDDIPVLTYVLNTAKYAIVVTAISLLFNSMAAYAFARMNFKGKNVIFTILIASMMIPFQVIMIPLFMELHFMGLYDTYAGMIIPKCAAVVGIFFMRSFFYTLPRQLEEAGRLDGLTEFGIFFRIILPLCKSALITQVVLTLTGCWNDLLWPLLMISSPEKRMLSNGIVYFVGQDVTQYGPTFAAGVVSIIPLLIMFIFGQKYFVNSIVSTGMKE